MEELAVYFDTNVLVRKNKSRVDVNVYGLDKLNDIISLFNSFPLSEQKHKEFLK
jgi:hypothetical protein